MRKSFETTHTTLSSTKMHQSMTIVQISDLHNACYGRQQEILASAVRAESPDMIAVTGDLFNRKDISAFQNALDLIDALVEIAPTFVVEGNHEARLNEWGEHLLESVRQRGTVLLRNESFSFRGIHIIGLKQRAESETLHALVKPAKFNLVLCHRPEYFPRYWDCGVDLILCGHAHGGQIRIGSVALLAPNQGMFPKYSAGLYAHGETRMYVSRGLGDTVRVLRIGNPHELAVFRLSPS